MAQKIASVPEREFQEMTPTAVPNPRHTPPRFYARATHKNTAGFTLIELLTSMAIIGVLAGVAIQQYSLYKIRGYDAHSKQALHDINLLCNAYWTDTVPEQECDLAKSKEYGFVQHSDVVATLPPSPLDNFCASAKHNSSPNTYSIDSVSLISSGSNCGGAGGASAPGQTFESYKPQDEACRGWNANSRLIENAAWLLVDSDGTRQDRVDDGGSRFIVQAYCEDGLFIDYEIASGQLAWRKRIKEGKAKLVFVPQAGCDGPQTRIEGGGPAYFPDCKPKVGSIVQAYTKYNFETGIWSNDQGEKFKNGIRVE